jgi:hypothetical protein
MEICESEKITPERAIEILGKDCIEVTLEEAKFILEFFYQMADTVVEQYLKKQNELPEYF